MGATGLTTDSAAPAPSQSDGSWASARRAAEAHYSAIPALVAVGLMVLWAAHDGGYDADTWYWGALVVLGLVVVLLSGVGVGLTRLDGALKVALLAFALYVAWSYLSITWAGSRGDALTGSNRALLYLLVFALFALTRWTPRRAQAILLAWVLGVGIIGALVLIAMARGSHVSSLFSEGRLLSPTGYFNSSAALFTSAAFVAVGLAVRKELPVLLRGVLIAIACEGVQLALLAESRGWLFTLPLMLLASIAVSRDRLRIAGAAVLPIVAALAPLSQMLDVFRATEGAHPTESALVSAAEHAARTSLLICVVMLVLGTLLAAADRHLSAPSLSPNRRRLLGAIAATVALGVAVTGALVTTHGHPISFVQRQWHGFTHPSATDASNSSSHFAVVGSARYDAWRVSLDAALAHPIGGLGQDNFADYYIVHRRTGEELQWTHSLEFRLLAHTGFVGFALFAVFLGAALTAAMRNRRQAGALAAAITGVALLPFVVWLIHGSVDWFWEMPALSGPALGFLAVAAALRAPRGAATEAPSRWGAIPRAAAVSVGVLALIAAVAVLGLPYLAVREVSTAADIRATNPSAALRDLSHAAKLNPLSADPGRVGGAIALQAGEFTEAERRFSQAISREPGGWFSWLGEGLAASALGDSARAHHAFAVAASINSRQPAVSQALARVYSRDPLTPEQAFGQLVLAH